MDKPERIGVRELRQNASVYLKAVRAGATYEVTSDGEPVALLVPVPRDRLARLVADGTVTPSLAPGAWRARRPLPSSSSGPSLGELLAELRADDR